MKKFIAVAGNIGVGKSTLVELLGQRLGWQPFYEPVTENPYLSDFYSDMKSWSFYSQTFFLAHRLRIHHDLIHYSGSVIQDRSIYEDAEIFAQNLYLQGYMSQRDYDTYRSLYQSVSDLLTRPDLVIYLRASSKTLMDRIAQRARPYEREITCEYLDGLNQLYEKWFSNFSLCPVLAVPADDLDYVAHPQHLDLVARKVMEKLTGKEEVVFSSDDLMEANGHS
jgi:deoxyadenosine/deoxycytidine kinase